MIMLKILIFLAVLALLALPFLPIPIPLTFYYYRDKEEERLQGLINILVVLAMGIVGIVLLPTIYNAVEKLGHVSFIAWILEHIPSYARYTTELAITIFINIAFCLAAILALGCFHSTMSISEWLREMWKKKKTARKERKTAKDPISAKNGKQKTTGSLPQELLPLPEEKPGGNRIVIPGARQEEKLGAPFKAKKAEKAGVADETDEELEETDRNSLADRIRLILFEKAGNVWYMRPQLRHVAKHLRSFLLLVSALYLLIFALLMLPMLFRVTVLEEPFYKLMQFFARIGYLFPTFALALLTEIFWFLDRKAAPIAPTVPEESPISAQTGRVVDLDLLEKDLMRVLGKNNDVKSIYSSDITPAAFDRTVVDVSNSPVLRRAADFVRSQNLELNQEYMLGLKHFQNGKDVLFHAPLYTSIGPYIYAVLNLRIAQGERLVVVCHNKSEVPNIIETLQQGLLKVSKTHKPLWRIADAEGMVLNADEDVLVLTPEEFREDDFFAAHKAFFRQVTAALLPDANLIVSANGYYCQIISYRLAQYCAKGLQYLFLSTRNTENLDSFLTEYFLRPEPPQMARGDYSYGEVHLYIWRKKQDLEIIDNAGQTVLPEVQIVNIASQHGIPGPAVISDGAIYSNQINTQWLDLYDASERPLGFAVVSDDYFNLPGVIYAYSRYMGKKASVLHVLTRQYLLRNYFYANASRYLFEEPLMQRSMTKHTETNKTDMIRLLCSLMEGIPQSAFIAEMNRITGSRDWEPTQKPSFELISKLVDQCLSIGIGEAPRDNEAHFSLYYPTDTFYPEPYVRIREGYDVLSDLLRETALVQVRFEGARTSVFLNLFTRMLDQRYLPEQNLIYANRNYRITRIDRDNGVIYASDAQSSHGMARDYIQIRRYAMVDGKDFYGDCLKVSGRSKPSSNKVSGARLELAGQDSTVNAMVLARSFEAFHAESDTVGYYILDTDGSTLRLSDSTIPIVWLHEGDREHLRRSISNGLYLKIEMSRAQDDRLTMTLAALMQEMMKTLFPDVYFCLSVCPILKNPNAICNNRDFSSRTIAQLYPSLSGWGSVCENSIELLILEDCRGGTGALDLLYEENATFLRNVFWMLSDYLEWQRENESSPYIFFGMDTQPKIFDLDAIRPIMKTFARSYIREHDVNLMLETSNHCALCGRKAEEPFLWKGQGRLMICRACSEEYVPDQEESALILDYARTWMTESFSIQLPQFSLKLVPSLPNDALSALDTDQQLIMLAEGLPLRTVHVQIVDQLIRLWQLYNLDITGNSILQGQCLYVRLQYLLYLQQFKYVQFLHREYLLGSGDAAQGYCELNQALQAEGHENSFLYLLSYTGKSTVPPVKKTSKKRSTRVPAGTEIHPYFRETLSEVEAATYDEIVDILLQQELEADLSDFHLTVSQVLSVHDAVLHDHPEIFWTNGSYSLVSGDDGIIKKYTPKYTLSHEERERMQKEIDDAVAPFLEEISDEMEDYETALHLYEKIIEFLDYDTIALERQKHKTLEERQDVMDDLRNIYGAIVKHKAVCAGYAKAYQYLLQKFGIEALYVGGECFSGERHAWNIVRLEGDYYHVDSTWADFSNTDPAKNKKGMSYAYFALTDEQIGRSRSIDAAPVPPSCTSDSCNYHVKNGLHFTKYDHTQIMALLTERFRDPDTKLVELRFDNAKLLRDAEYYICKNGGIFEALHKAGRNMQSIKHFTVDELYLLQLSID